MKTDFFKIVFLTFDKANNKNYFFFTIKELRKLSFILNEASFLNGKKTTLFFNKLTLCFDHCCGYNCFVVAPTAINIGHNICNLLVA